MELKGRNGNGFSKEFLNAPFAIKPYVSMNSAARARAGAGAEHTSTHVYSYPIHPAELIGARDPKKHSKSFQN